MKNIEIKNSTKCNVECQVIDDTTTRIVINDEYVPKDGDFVYCKVKGQNAWVFIHKQTIDDITSHYVTTTLDCGFLDENSYICENHQVDVLRPATPEEIQLLTDKLKEQGKRWNAEKKVIEDLPKEPKVGDMCIFWDNDKREAICGIRKAHYEEGSYYTNEDISYNNCIPFESVEQYKKFISND